MEIGIEDNAAVSDSDAEYCRFGWIRRHTLHWFSHRFCRCHMFGHFTWFILVVRWSRSRHWRLDCLRWHFHPAFRIHKECGGNDDTFARLYTSQDLNQFPDLPSGFDLAGREDTFALLDI